MSCLLSPLACCPGDKAAHQGQSMVNLNNIVSISVASDFCMSYAFERG